MNVRRATCASSPIIGSNMIGCRSTFRRSVYDLLTSADITANKINIAATERKVAASLALRSCHSNIISQSFSVGSRVCESPGSLSVRRGARVAASRPTTQGNRNELQVFTIPEPAKNRSERRWRPKMAEMAPKRPKSAILHGTAKIFPLRRRSKLRFRPFRYIRPNDSGSFVWQHCCLQGRDAGGEVVGVGETVCVAVKPVVLVTVAFG